MSKQNIPTLAIVIPCYNEADVFPETAKCLTNKFSQLVSEQIVSHNSILLFIDDGSTDNTWFLIEKYHNENPVVINGIKLSNNYGQQNALLCGLLFVKDFADVIISIDADLQDDINVIDKMLNLYHKNNSDIILGIRSNREKDSLFKRITAWFYYCLMRFFGAKLEKNHADFRLMSKDAIAALESHLNTENNKIFLRGIITKLGLKTDSINYTRNKRLAGKSKYTFGKMVKLAFDGFLSASIPGKFIRKIFKPLKQKLYYNIEKVLFITSPQELQNDN